MVIFEPNRRKGYEIINCVNGADYQAFRLLDGTSRKADWKPIRVQRVRAYWNEAFRPADFPWYGDDILVMRRSAVEALRDMLDAHGEVLPLETEDGIELYAFNARVIDALDKERSSLMYFGDEGRILHVKKAVFTPSAVQGVDMFRVPTGTSSTYVSERFVERVQAAKLTGLTFTEEWSSG
jgi:uncharacterized protein DUF1629